MVNLCIDILCKGKTVYTNINSQPNLAVRCEAADVTSLQSSLNNKLQLALNQTKLLNIIVFKRVISTGSSQILLRIFKINIIAYIYDRFKLQKLNFTVGVLGGKHNYHTINLPGSLRRQNNITQIYPKQHWKLY